MQKKPLIILVAALFLAGCSGNPATDESTAPSNQMSTTVALTLGASVPEIVTPIPEVSNTATPIPVPTGDPAMLNTNYENALPVDLQLVLGTLKLGGTNQDITPEQAPLLLPLWQALRGLIDAGNDPAMISSQTTFIINTMNMEQITTIAAMQLTKDDLINISMGLGLEMAGGSTSQNQAGNAPAGNAPAGNAPSAGGKFSGGQSGAQGQGNSNNQQDVSPEGNSNPTQGLNPALIDAIIEFLTAKIS